MHIGFWWANQKETDHYEGLYVSRRLMLEKLNGRLWSGFIWLRIGSSGGLF
jgi:hypothetical protein